MHVIDSLAIGGAERMLVDIANASDRAKVVPSTCVTRTDDFMAKCLKPDTPFRVLNRRWSFDPAGFIGLRGFAREQNVDVFHVHGRSSCSFLLAARALGFIHQPIVLHDHFGNIDIDERVPAWFKVFGARQIDYYVGVCDKLTKWAIAAGVDPRRVATIGNTLDLQRFDHVQPVDLHAALNIPSEKKIGLMIANLRPAKGLDILIDLCKELPRTTLPVFVIIGKTPDPDYFQLCHEKILSHHLQGNFRFVGQQDEPVHWMKSVDFAVMPSRSESGPLVLIEYMAAGLPFVAFCVGGISRAIGEDFPEWVAAPGDTGELSRKLVNMLDEIEHDHSSRKKQALDYAMTTFDIRNTMATWNQTYRSAMNGLR